MTSSFGFGALGEETALFGVVEFVRRCFDAGESFCWFLFIFSFFGGGGKGFEFFEVLEREREFLVCWVFLVCFVGWAVFRSLKQVRFGRADQVIVC